MNHPIPRTTGQAACVAVVTTGLLAACAVGPNFKAPEAPRNAGFAPPGQIAPETTAAPLPGGQAQRFVDGMDIPGQWWTLFQSAQLNALIERALKNSPTLRAQISATEDIARSQQMQLDITQRRFAAGATSRADVLQQQATLQATLATLPSLRNQLAQERNQLAAYIGDFPSNYTGAEFNLDSLNLPQDLPVSLPSKLVEQRPDVPAYSSLLHQATAQIGVATANMLPQITLSGSYGQDAAKFSNIFSPSSNVFSLIGSITQPIFKGGQLLHQRRAAVAAAQEAAANYQATVITAFQNVSNTLYALQADADALAAQATAERSAADSLTLVQAQYKSGAASYVQVLTSEQSYQSAAVALVKARAQRYADTAALFQALGGGWWNRNEALADISTTAGSRRAQ